MNDTMWIYKNSQGLKVLENVKDSQKKKLKKAKND